MRLVLQRVCSANVVVEGQMINSIGKGLMLLVGVEKGDTENDIEWLAAKTANMRIFPDDEGTMNLSVIDINGEILAISQFTLTASTKKGNRPSYIRAETPSLAEKLYNEFCNSLSMLIRKEVKKGIFGADMKVTLTNDGPVTIIIDSRIKE